MHHQDIYLVNHGETVATDSNDYLVAKFNQITDDWDTPLNAIFVNSVDNVPYTVMVGQEAQLEADECFVPWEVLVKSGYVYVSVFCGSRHTTSIARFKVVESGYVAGETPGEPTPTVYEQLLQAFDNVYTKAEVYNKSEVYNKEEITEHLAPIQSAIDTLDSTKANKATTLAGYNITDAYTKIEVDEKLLESEKYHYDTESTQLSPTIIEGAFCSDSGDFIANQFFDHTDYLDVQEFDGLKITSAYGYNAVLVAFYDQSKNFISYVGKSSGTLVTVTEYEVQIPENAHYAVINCAASKIDILSISALKIIDITIEDKLKQVSDDVDALDELKGNVYTKTEVDTKISESEKYDYDGTEQTIDYSLDDAYEFCDKNGRFIENSSYRHTDYFDIRDYDKLKLSTRYGLAAVLVAFFDNANAFIGYFNDSASATVTVTDKVVDISSFKNNGAVKAIVNCANAYIDSLSIKGISIIDITIEDKLKQVADDTTVLNTLKGKKLFVGGDSIMFGHGSNGYAIGEYLRDKYDMDLTKSAQTGATLSTLYNKNIYNQFINLNDDYDVFILDGGVNDKARGYDLGTMSTAFENFNPEKVIGALEAICRHLVLNYPNAKKLFIISNEMTTPSYAVNKAQIEYLESLIPVLNKWGIPYVNMLNTSMKAFNVEYNHTYFFQDDRLHPNLFGYQTFYFEKIEQALLFGATNSTTAEKETSISEANIRLSRTNYVYDGSSHVPNVSAVTLNGQTLTPNVDYVTVQTPATNAGDYIITINGIGNYTGTATAEWTISKAQATISGDDSISISGVGNSLTKTYTTDGDGTFSFSASGGVATVTNVDGTVTVTSTEIGIGTIVVSVSEGQNYLGATKTVNITVEEVVAATVFGVMWGYSLLSPELTRLTPESDPLGAVTAVPAQEPTACIGTEGGQSDFDNYMPWAGIQRFNYVDGQIVDFVDYTNGETYVYIPEFWSKIVTDSENQKMYFYISDSELNGFTKHPGSGRYIGRYPCGTDYKSIPNSAPNVDKTINEFRTALQAKDSRLYVSDIHMYEVRKLLYLVEWANFNSQDCIGMGIVAGSIKNSGATDILTYHTGRADGTNNQSAIQYRWIENPWGNIWQFVDGVLVNDYNAYICNNVDLYSDSLTENYINTGAILPNAFGYVRTLTAYNNGYIFPQYTSGASDSTYVCDYYYGNTGLRAVSTGGTTNNGVGAGLFFWSGYDDSSAHGNNSTARPMLIPNSGGNG